jgi:hypothetical protein
VAAGERLDDHERGQQPDRQSGCRAPPAASTPTSPNCEPPENSSSDSAPVCATDSPAATDTAPNDSAYAPGGEPDAQTRHG